MIVRRMFSDISWRDMFSLCTIYSDVFGEKHWENMGMFTKETPHRYILSTEVHRLQLASIYVKTLFPVCGLFQASCQSSFTSNLVFFSQACFEAFDYFWLQVILWVVYHPPGAPAWYQRRCPPVQYFFPFAEVYFSNFRIVFLWFNSCLIPTLLSFMQHFSSFSDRQ